MHQLFNGIYKGRNVLITGHTGFKGSWLTYWLTQMGAQVTGISLNPNTNPNHFDCLDLSIDHRTIDIRDREKLERAVTETEPEIIFHLAAQPLVRFSYDQPRLTYETNVLGTINLYEACKNLDSLSAIVTITSDKVYENRELPEGYVESDRLGGHDPYSNSKACTELVTSCYRECFFANREKAPALVATVRAGNVIGGGDWALDRIVPDIVRAASTGKATIIRNPDAIRPWQHVLDPLSGYLLVGQRLLQAEQKIATCWNFGPEPSATVSVKKLGDSMSKHWPAISLKCEQQHHAPKETNVLTLQSEKAKTMLGWNSIWNFDETVSHVAAWYREYYLHHCLLTEKQLTSFVEKAKERSVPWASK